MKVSNQIIHREIAGEHILIPVGETALKIHGLMTMTESGVLLFNTLKNECTEKDLVQVILKKYDVDEGTAKADINEFLTKLDMIGILER